jgi:hypothetical protein
MKCRALLASTFVAATAFACTSPLADSAEAKQELARLVAAHKAQGYLEWRRALESKMARIHHEFTATSGTWYQVVVHPVWDDRPGGVIRLVVCIDDGGASAYIPLCDGALLTPPIASK